jgi:dephospho-CoA kinase
MSRARPVIGLCGGIGSGKSTVARLMAELGGLVVDSDELNERVLRRGDVQATLRSWWGSRVFRADGSLDRRRVAGIVFADAAERRRLESLTHPLIAQMREDIIKAHIEDPAVRAVILDSPLLFESQLDRECDAVVFVEADEGRRRAQVRASRGWDAEQLRRREASQIPLDQKRTRSHYVICNDGPLERLRSRTAEIFERIVSGHNTAR